MRDRKELMDWADQQPYNALLFITVEEARQFVAPASRGGFYNHFGIPLNFMGRRCVISDLPPNHYLSTDGKVLPL
jgi:hypothetical protein